MPKVSVIVPTYNYAHFLPRCLDSLVNQSLQDIEIIVADDCSTDNTAEVVKPYLSDARVKYIKNQINQKLYASRIIGMKASTGDYIAHCDADDLYELNAMEQLYNHAQKTDADIVTGNAVNSSKNNYIKPIKAQSVQGSRVFLVLLKKILPNSVMWRALYKKELVQKYLTVAPDIHINSSEDALANFILYSCAQKWEHINKAVYHYCINAQSISLMTNPQKLYALLADTGVFYGEIQKIIHENKRYLPYKKEISLWADSFVYFVYTQLKQVFPDSHAQEWVQHALPLLQERLLSVIFDYQNTPNSPALQGIKGEFIRLMQAVKIGLKKYFD